MEINEKQLTDLTEGILSVKQTLEKNGKANDTTMEKVSLMEKAVDQIIKDVGDMKRQRIIGRASAGQLRAGSVVSDECAKWLGSYFVLALEAKGSLKLESETQKQTLLKRALENMGIESRSTLTTSDIPMPTEFSGEVVELVWKYGQARQFGTVYPLGTSTVKLPKLTTSPAFGLITAGGTVTEKSPQIGFVTFTPAKWGGMVRYPSEIDADSIVALGQFFARYIAREMAKIEDTVFFTADGSGTYNSLTGLLGQASTLSKSVVATTGNTAPDDLTLANFRAVRAKVSSAALPTAGYYMNATMEAQLVSFNTSATVTPYIANGPNGPTLDGFPVRWVDVLPVFTTSATVSAKQVLFGDPSFHYLGMRQGLSVDLSREVYFATDEHALRALERFTTGLMADDANAVLITAAS